MTFTSSAAEAAYFVLPQGGGSEESRRLAIIVNVGDGADGVGDLVVHDGVDVYSHRVLG